MVRLRTCTAGSASCASTKTTMACRSEECVPPGASHSARRSNVHLDASLWRPGDDNAFDLTEAYLEYRPYPAGGWRSRVKLGAFYAPISLEHRAAGWTNPYLISSSAINTWVGEELRTIGAEYSLEWLGTRSGHDFDAGFVAAIYGYNDPAGVLIASRGWALHDRQTTLVRRSRRNRRRAGSRPRPVQGNRRSSGLLRRRAPALSRPRRTALHALRQSRGSRRSSTRASTTLHG